MFSSELEKLVYNFYKDRIKKEDPESGNIQNYEFNYDKNTPGFIFTYRSQNEQLIKIIINTKSKLVRVNGRIFDHTELKFFDLLGYELTDGYMELTKQKITDWIYDD